MKRLALLLLLLVMLPACTPAQLLTPLVPTPTPVVVPVETLHWVYPEAYTPLVKVLARAYQQIHPTQRLDLIPRAEALAWDALAHGEADLAWVMTVPDDTSMWTQHLAWDGLALIVHPFNGVPGLTLRDAQQLLSGQAVNWANLNGPEGMPQVISREESSGEAACLRQYVLGGNRITPTALLAPSTELMVQSVAETPMAIGYVLQSRLTSDVRAVAVEGIPPTPETLAAGLYPLRVDVWLAAPAAPQTGALLDLVTWLQGPEARAILEAHGLVVP